MGTKLRCNCILFSDQHEEVASISIAVTVRNYSINRYKNLNPKILKRNTVNAFYLVINKTDGFFKVRGRKCIQNVVRQPGKEESLAEHQTYTGT